MKTNINQQNREQAIEKIKKLGAKDITAEMHPNKVGKYYFKLDLLDDKFISFNIDYSAYEEMWVTCWINGSYESHLIRFDEFIKKQLPIKSKKIVL